MKVLVVANLKGGVAKTATTHALGVALARDRRVLLVDADPQASLSRACGMPDMRGRSLAEVLDENAWPKRTLREVIRELGDGLALVPSHPSLATVERALRNREKPEGVLKRALAAVARGHAWTRPSAEYSAGLYDLVVIDTPPRVDLLTVNALVAADAVLIPTVPEALAFESLRLFCDHVNRIRQTLNPRLQILGVLLTFFDGHLLHHRAIRELIRLQGFPLLDVTVGRSIRVAEASGAGQSVISYSEDSKRALEYSVLATVVAGWLDDQELVPRSGRG